MQTSKTFYLRLHGNPLLFRSSYDSIELENFHSAFPESCKEYHVFFNNTAEGAAFRNAQELMQIIHPKKVKV